MMSLVQTRGNRPRTSGTILMVRLGSWWFRFRLRLVFRERRRLTLQRSQRVFQFFKETLVLCQRLLQLVLQRLDLGRQRFLFGRTQPPYNTSRREICPAP